VAFGSGRGVPGKSRTMVLLTPNNSLDRSAGKVFFSPVVSQVSNYRISLDPGISSNL
jgi:hypothetical protein